MLRLARHRFSIHWRQLGGRRRISNIPEYSHKVTAWPFCLSAQDAVVKMGPYASVLCLFRNIVGSLGARILPNLFTPIQPAQIVPIYFPAWFIDTELGADITMGEDQRKVSVISNNAYMPGCSFEWVSKRNFRPRSFWDGPLPQPFTPDMAKQHGEEIICLPYTCSPLPVFDRLKSLSYSQARINEDLRFNPSSLDIRLLAAHPVLIPFYLSRYECHLTDEISLNLIFLCEAYKPDGSAHLEVDTGSLAAALTKAESAGVEGFGTQLVGALNSYLNDNPKPRIAGAHRPTRNHHFAAPRVLSPLRNPPLGDQLGSWIEQLIDSPEADLVINNDNLADLSDMRVRPFSEEEGKANRKWMLLTQDVAEMTSLADALSGVDSSDSEPKQTTIIIKNGKIQKGKDLDISSDLRTTIAAVLAKKRDTQPGWWRAWLEEPTDRKS
jgi:hypothetical protein